MEQLRVLIPLDGTAAAEQSLACLPWLQSLGDLSIRLLSVAGHAPEGRLPLEQTEAYLFRQELHLKAAGYTVDSLIHRGEPALAIVTEADAFRAGLVVMGSHARTEMDRWRQGSVTEHVARLSLHDMLVVPQSPVLRDTAPSRIAIPLDGSEAAEKALDSVSTWASLVSAQLHLIQALSLSTVPQGAHSFESGQLVSNSLAYLQERTKQTAVEDTHTAVLTGSPAEAIVDYCASEGIDLVALTAHGRGSGSQVGIGRVASRMLQSGLPVLLLRSWESRLRSGSLSLDAA